MTRADAIDLFYGLMNELAARTGGTKLLTDDGLARTCPRAGLYFFYENGEIRPNGERRVGPNRYTRRDCDKQDDPMGTTRPAQGKGRRLEPRRRQPPWLDLPPTRGLSLAHQTW